MFKEEMFNEKEYQKEYHIKNKDRRKEYHKEYNKVWYQKNKIKLSQYQEQYRKENKNKMKELHKQWYQKNKIKINIKHKEYHKKYAEENLTSWEGYIPKETNCQICNKKIYFNQRNRTNAIHFDHKDENVLIKRCPTSWLGRNSRTPEVQKIWEDCKFGMLCIRCNGYLPTKGREQFARNIVKYICGNNAIITLK